MSTRFLRWGLLAAFLLQTALLAWMIVDRAMLLTNGREVRLAVLPVDPRDLLRGDFVVLAYEISRIDTDAVEGDDAFGWQDTIYVSLEKIADGWQVASVWREAPASGLFLKGTITDLSSGEDCAGAAPCLDLGVDYDLERFFVPEGEGRELETLRNDQRVSVDVAVADDGRAALKRLLVDDQIRFEERLY